MTVHGRRYGRHHLKPCFMQRYCMHGNESYNGNARHPGALSQLAGGGRGGLGPSRAVRGSDQLPCRPNEAASGSGRLSISLPLMTVGGQIGSRRSDIGHSDEKRRPDALRHRRKWAATPAGGRDRRRGSRPPRHGYGRRVHSG